MWRKTMQSPTSCPSDPRSTPARRTSRRGLQPRSIALQAPSAATLYYVITFEHLANLVRTHRVEIRRHAQLFLQAADAPRRLFCGRSVVVIVRHFRVAATVKESPGVQAIDADHWTNGRLRTVLRRRVGVDYSRGYIWEIASRAGVADLLTRRRN